MRCNVMCCIVSGHFISHCDYHLEYIEKISEAYGSLSHKVTVSTAIAHVDLLTLILFL